MKHYTVTFLNYDSSQRIPSDCNGITFLNQGTTVVTVENVVLQPTQSLAIEGNECEFTGQVFQINFSSVGQNNLTVIKKTYV